MKRGWIPLFFVLSKIDTCPLTNYNWIVYYLLKHMIDKGINGEIRVDNLDSLNQGQINRIVQSTWGAVEMTFLQDPHSHDASWNPQKSLFIASKEKNTNIPATSQKDQEVHLSEVDNQLNAESGIKVIDEPTPEMLEVIKRNFEK